jgi:hypothetical protein
MSKWLMRGHFGHLHFKTFPMTLGAHRCEEIWPLKSFPEFSRVPEDSKFPLLGVWASPSHLTQSGVATSWFGEPIIRLGMKVRSNSRIHFASNPSKLVFRKLDPGTLSKVGLHSTALCCCTYKITFDNILANIFGFFLEMVKK